jgi:ABC-type uncharacterized transport system permease subunit
MSSSPLAVPWRTRLNDLLRDSGAGTALLTVALAFVIGGLAVAIAGYNPLTTYRAIFTGAGLDYLLPWVSGPEREAAGFSLQQTLLLATPLVMLGIAVAIAFRAGLFNIGGQGQYLVGSIVAIWVGSSLAGLPGWLHILLVLVLGSLAGGLWAGIAGMLRATAGANEVVTTIMLNYVAIWIGVYLFGVGGPLQDSREPTVPVSREVVEAVRLPVIWGDATLQGLHVGVFAALGSALVMWVLLSRTVLGYEWRATGSNPEAARYAGVRLGRSYFQVMAVCGLFAGLAGAIDVLGWQFRLAATDVQASQLGFLGIAVALLGRNSPIGIVLSSLLFGALLTGTSVRNLDPTVFPPVLATNLTFVIQGVVVLLVSADLLILYLWRLRRRAGLPRRRAAGRPEPVAAELGGTR